MIQYHNTTFIHFQVKGGEVRVRPTVIINSNTWLEARLEGFAPLLVGSEEKL